MKRRTFLQWTGSLFASVFLCTHDASATPQKIHYTKTIRPKHNPAFKNTIIDASSEGHSGAQAGSCYVLKNPVYPYEFFLYFSYPNWGRCLTIAELACFETTNIWSLFHTRAYERSEECAIAIKLDKTLSITKYICQIVIASKKAKPRFFAVTPKWQRWTQL